MRPALIVSPARPVSALISLALIGCNSVKAPSAPDQSPPERPSFTLGAGTTNAPIARGNLGTLQLQSKFGQYTIELKTHDDTDVEVRTLTFAPGAYTGWHSHPGPVILVLKSGTLTVYDPLVNGCAPVTHTAGSAFIEGTTPHYVRNEGTVDAETGLVFFLPTGAARRIDETAPANCPP